MSYPSGREAKIAGSALFIGVVQFALAVFVAQFLYPGYSVSQQAISDLGATCRQGSCQIFQPSSTIFNSSIVLAGLLVLITGFYFRKSVRANIVVACALISGAAMIGIGVFPETFGIIHNIASGIAFLFISFTAITAYRVQRSPFSYFSVVLGVISLAAAVLYEDSVYLGLGQGGMERMIVYPVLLWAVAFSGQLVSQGQVM